MIIERIERWRALQQPMCHAVRYEQLAKSEVREMPLYPARGRSRRSRGHRDRDLLKR